MLYTGKTHQHAQRLTLPVVDTFIDDLKGSVREAKESPSGDGTMVAVYGTFFYAAAVTIELCRLSSLSIIRNETLPFFF